jgi:carbon monoxide dehydrogenase subunit G
MLILSSDAFALEWQADDQGWRFSRRIGDVDIYLRPVEESTFPALRAHARIDAPLAAIYAVISDYDNFQDFIPSVLDSRILKRHKDTAWVYQRLGFPLMVADRHYVIKVTDTLNQAEAGYIEVDWHLDREQSRSLRIDGAVLPNSFSGSWQLTALKNGQQTDATYSIHVEPGGMLPAWLYSDAGENYVLGVIEAVRMELEGRR